MKRNSSWPRRGFAQAGLHLCGLLVLLACTPGIVQAWSYGSYEGVHYSPYALRYYGSGLIAGDVQYSPYALNYSGSNFIYDGTQYTPYVLSYYNSGLVQDYGTYPGYATTFVFPAQPFHRGWGAPALIHRAPPAVRRHGNGLRTAEGGGWMEEGRATRIRNPKSEIRNGPSAGRLPNTGPRDPMDVIRQHLRTRGFASPCIDRILRVENQLVSVDFLVRDRNLLIKYWNPQELQRLGIREGYQQKACAKYQEDWERYAQRYRRTGGEIYTINVSEPEAIVAALDACTRLRPGQDETIRPTLYAQANPQ